MKIFIIILLIITFFFMLNILFKKNNEFFNKQKSGLLCGNKNDPCSINSCGDSTCCDNYDCKLPDGNYQYKICVNKDRFKLPNLSFNGPKLPKVNDLISFIDGYYYNNTTIFNDLTKIGNNYQLSKNVIIGDYGNFNLLNTKIIGFPSNKIPNNNFSFLFILNKKSDDNKIQQEIINQEDMVGIENVINNKIIFPTNNNKKFNLSMTNKNIFFINDDIFKSYKNINIIDFKNLNIPDTNPLFIEYKDNYFYVKYNNNTYKSNKQVDINNAQSLNINYDANIFTLYFNDDMILTQNINNINFNVNKFIINEENIYFSIIKKNIIIFPSDNNINFEFSITNKNVFFINNDLFKSYENINITDFKNLKISNINPLFIEYKNNYFYVKYNNYTYKSNKKVNIKNAQSLNINYDANIFKMYFNNIMILTQNINNINFNVDKFIINEENIYFENFKKNIIKFPTDNNTKFEITVRDKNIFFISGDVFKSYENINITDFKNLNILSANPLFIEYKDNYFYVKYKNYIYKSNKKVDISTAQSLNINYDANIFKMNFNNITILSQNINNINFNVDKFTINNKNIYFQNIQKKIISPNYSLIQYFVDNKNFEIMLNDNYVLLNINNHIYKSTSRVSLGYKNLLSIIYSDNFMNIYFNENNILAANIGPINFNSNNFIINKNKNLDFDLHSILVYKTNLNISDINITKNFFENDYDKIYLPHFGDIFKFPKINFNFINICKSKL